MNKPVQNTVRGVKTSFYVSKLRPSTHNILSLPRRVPIFCDFRAARRGMWKKGTQGETPAEYKRRHAQGETISETSKSAKQEKVRPRDQSVGWFRKLWGSK